MRYFCKSGEAGHVAVIADDDGNVLSTSLPQDAKHKAMELRDRAANASLSAFDEGVAAPKPAAAPKPKQAAEEKPKPERAHAHAPVVAAHAPKPSTKPKRTATRIAAEKKTTTKPKGKWAR